MTEYIRRLFTQMGYCVASPILALAGALGSVPAPAGTAGVGLSPADRERIQQSLSRIRRDLETLGGASFLSEIVDVTNRAFGGFEGLLISLRAWADLVDALVLEAEGEFGGVRGRGRFKKRHVKAGLLYLVNRLDIDVPKVPAFVTPLVWDLLLEGLIDAVVQFSNRNQRWGDAPQAPTFRRRLNLGAQHVAVWTESFTKTITRIAWWIVLRSSPASPGMKEAVDVFVARNPEPLRAVIVLGTWGVNHTGDIVALADLFSVAVTEAQFVVTGDAERRRAYALEVALVLIGDAVGLPARGTLGYFLLSSVLEIGIDLASRLLERRGAGAVGSTLASS